MNFLKFLVHPLNAFYSAVDRTVISDYRSNSYVLRAQENKHTKLV